MKSVPIQGESETDSNAGLLLLVLGLLFLRWFYLALFCPYSLVEDEAHYWEWSQHLALSYYTKGPGIAWLIATTTAILGDTEFGVRAAAPLFSALLTFAVAKLTLDVTGGDRRKALYAAIAIQLAPIFQATSLLATIDGPYCACWALAAWAGWRAIAGRGKRAAWLSLGLAMGIGFLFKYTILLLIPALIAFAIWHRRKVAPSKRPTLGPMLTAAAFIFTSAPVIIWNQDNGWPTIRHLLGHLGMAESAAASAQTAASHWEWSPLWPLEFLGTQIGLVGPLLLLSIIAGIATWRRAAAASAGLFFLLLCGTPILIFYFFVSLIAQPEGNWPMAGYVTLLPLAGIFAADAITDYRARVSAWLAKSSPRPKEGILRRKPETAGQMFWHIGIAYGLIAGVLMLRADMLATIPGLGRFIPMGRLDQGRIMARSVQQLRDQLRAEHPDLRIIARHYGRASQLAFYLTDHPIVFCASSATGGRRTQQDDWYTHDLGKIPPNRPVLLIGGDEQVWSKLFTDIKPLGPVAGAERKGVDAFFATTPRKP